MPEDIGLSSVLDNSDFSDGLNEYTRGLAQMTGETVSASGVLGSSFAAAGGGISAFGEIAIGALRRIGEMAVNAMGEAARAVQAFVTDSFAGMLEDEQVLTRLNQVIKSTGGIAGVTADDAKSLAAQFHVLAGGSEETVLGIVDMGLRMGTISKEQMPEFIQATLDLGAVMGSTERASFLLSRAMDDPVGTLGQLRRAGIMATQAEKDHIKALDKAGDAAGATAALMDVVARATKGAAAANLETAAGQWELLKTTVAEAGETVLSSLLPPLHELFDKIITPALPLIEEFAAAFGAAFGSLIEGDIGGAFDALMEFNNVRAVFKALGIDLTTVGGQIEDFAGSVMAWFGENIPIAIQTASDIWTDTLQPAIQGVGDWIDGNLMPLLSGLWDILGPAGESTLAQLSVAWTNQLLPDLQAVGAWMQANLLPILGELWTWIAANLPPAVKTLADFWTGTLLPAVLNFSDWYRDTLGPLLAELFVWLQTNIPLALQTLSDFWTGTLQPAITAVWAWLTGTLVPTLSELWTWLSEMLTEALQTLSDYWTGTLLPALEGVWSWMNTILFPFLHALSNFLGVAFTLVVTALAGLWQNVLLPAFTAVWSFLDKNIFPVFTAIGDYLTETFQPILEGLGAFISDYFLAVLNSWKQVVDDISNALYAATQWIDAVAAGLRSLKLPGWLTPGSPTPLELGLRGISDEMQKLSTLRLPTFSASLRATGGASSPAMGMTGGNVNTVHNASQTSNFNLAVNTRETSRSVIADFYLMRAWGGV